MDIGLKSEGVVPLDEVKDHDGNVKFQPGDEIDVMVEKGHTEEGYVNLSTRRRSVCTPGTRSKKPTTTKLPSRLASSIASRAA